MKRVAIIILANVAILTALYFVYNLFQGNQADNKQAVKIDENNEKISVEDLGQYFADYDGAFVLFDQS